MSLFILLTLAIVLIVYVATFKNDFSEEHINKLIPVIGLIVGIFVLTLILGLMGWRS